MLCTIVMMVLFILICQYCLKEMLLMLGNQNTVIISAMRTFVQNEQNGQFILFLNDAYSNNPRSDHLKMGVQEFSESKIAFASHHFESKSTDSNRQEAAKVVKQLVSRGV